MRKIEKEMMAAIDGGRDWAKDNTAVLVTRCGYRRYTADVYLFGNHIADVFCNMAGDVKVSPNVDTLREHPTRTTMSRLRALGVDVCTRKGVVHLNGNPI